MAKYDAFRSRIVMMKEIIDEYSNESDLVERAEVAYENLRANNKSAFIAINMEQLASQTLSSINLADLIRSPGRTAMDAAIRTLRSTIGSREVGPIEELPITNYTDRYRLEEILKHTQIGAEQGLIAKLSVARGNKYNPLLQYGKTDGLDDVFRLADVRGNLKKKNLSLIGSSGVERAIKNEYTPDDEYGRRKTITENWIYQNRDFPFKLQFVSNPDKYEVFPATIEDFAETNSATWNSVSLINRSEDVYIYQGASRSITMGFVLYASDGGHGEEKQLQDTNGYVIHFTDEKQIFVMNKQNMWRKINFLQQCLQPAYSMNKNGTASRYSSSPYLKFWFGDLYHGDTHYLIIDGLTFNYDPLVWDLNNDYPISENLRNVDMEDKKSSRNPNGTQWLGIKPMIVKVNLTGTILLGKAPGSSSEEFYQTMR